MAALQLHELCSTFMRDEWDNGPFTAADSRAATAASSALTSPQSFKLSLRPHPKEIWDVRGSDPFLLVLSGQI